jgi:broad specificity phosphatase PhoE
MPQPTVIHFVRHGEVDNPARIYYGRLPRFGLSSTGLLQAEKTAQALKALNIRHVFSSPMLRARQTAKVINLTTGLNGVKISTLLNEVSTPYDGHPQADLFARNWDIYTGTPSSYEQPVDVLDRAKKFIQRIVSACPGQQVVAVTHGDIIFYLALWANGFAATIENKGKLLIFGLPNNYPDHASITTLTVQGNLVAVRYQQVLEEHNG